MYIFFRDQQFGLFLDKDMQTPPPIKKEPFRFFFVEIVEKRSKRKKNLNFSVMIDFIHNFQVLWGQFRSKMMFISKDPKCSGQNYFLCDSKFFWYDRFCILPFVMHLELVINLKKKIYFGRVASHKARPHVQPGGGRCPPPWVFICYKCPPLA